MEWRERKRVTLLAIDLVVLRGNDLPLTIAFQPRICPDLALLRVWMRFVFADRVLAAVNDGHVFVPQRRRRRRREEAHLGIVEVHSRAPSVGLFHRGAHLPCCSARR